MVVRVAQVRCGLGLQKIPHGLAWMGERWRREVGRGTCLVILMMAPSRIFRQEVSSRLVRHDGRRKDKKTNIMASVCARHRARDGPFSQCLRAPTTSLICPWLT